MMTIGAILAFRLWVGRVLHYTLRIAVRGHAFANDISSRHGRASVTLDSAGSHSSINAAFVDSASCC